MSLAVWSKETLLYCKAFCVGFYVLFSWNSLGIHNLPRLTIFCKEIVFIKHKNNEFVRCKLEEVIKAFNPEEIFEMRMIVKCLSKSASPEN